MAEFDAEDEGIRGCGYYGESGEHFVDIPVWRGAADATARPEIFEPGTEVQLSPGESVFSPVLSPIDFDSGDVIRYTNPSDEQRISIGFHLHDAPGTFSPPAGYSFTTGYSYYDLRGLAWIEAGDTVFRLNQVIAQPGSVIPIDSDAVVTFFQIDAGELVYTRSDDDGFTMTWTPVNFAGKVSFHPDVAHEVLVTGDVAFEGFELVVLPSAPMPEELRPR